MSKTPTKSETQQDPFSCVKSKDKKFESSDVLNLCFCFICVEVYRLSQ